ncbi:MAG: branched-chain amino acid aminotransferase [Halobacteriovoraceae bacterium]|nr:branched-chain amino acid aminotransferase [Halobacteriovoraceae bacterium]MCB9094212.1 branched-chain amino acid aminotransferase [Halobacteriovoraceae bacterium]
MIIDPLALEALKNFKKPEQLGFGGNMAPAMVSSYYKDGQWSELKLETYGPISLDPAAKVLHYAQEIFEGLKAYKNDRGELYLFRPGMNAKRFNFSAKRLGMPTFSEEDFLKSVQKLAFLSEHVIDTKPGSSFYLRPFMIGDEPQLGVKPSSTYRYYLIGAPSGNYFARDAIRVYVEDKYHRAALRGTGNAKTGGNYSASLASYIETKNRGYDQTLWLESVEDKYIEELSGMNFFAVINDVFVTPPLTGSILEGITRDSLIALGKHLGYAVEERKIELKELMKQVESGECSEAFACGTASVLVPIESLYYRENEVQFKVIGGPKTMTLKKELLKIQMGVTDDVFNWRVPIKNLN